VYAVPTVPLGNEAVVMVIAGQPMVNVNALVIVCPAEQLPVACTVKVDVPADVGVPLMRPVVVLKVNPAGSVPLAMAHA
jgi:hypothetical protein